MVMRNSGDAYLEAYVRLAAYGKAGAERASSIRRGAPENGGSNASPLSHALSHACSEWPCIRIASAALHVTGECTRFEGVASALAAFYHGRGKALL